MTIETNKDLLAEITQSILQEEMKAGFIKKEIMMHTTMIEEIIMNAIHIIKEINKDKIMKEVSHLIQLREMNEIVLLIVKEKIEKGHLEKEEQEKDQISQRNEEQENK